MKNKLSLLPVLLSTCVILQVTHAVYASVPPAYIKIPSRVDHVDLPAGAVIIDTLKQLGSRVYIPTPQKVKSTAPYKVALNLGIAVAGGFASISERDKGKLEQYADIIFAYGKLLNVQESLLREYSQVKGAIKQGDWKKVGALISLLQEQVKVELNKSYRKDEAKLAVIAGWMEGFHIVGKTLENNFNPKVAKELLAYRDLPDYLNQLIHSLRRQTKGKQEVREILVAMRRINQIVNQPPSYQFTQADVKKILAITTPLRKIIMQ